MGTFKHGHKFTFSNPDNVRLNGHCGYGRKKVKCINDGKTYDSISEAARVFGLFQASISHHLKKGTESVNGFKFEFVN